MINKKNLWMFRLLMMCEKYPRKNEPAQFQMPGGELQKNFKKVKTEEDVAAVFSKFFGSERWGDCFIFKTENSFQDQFSPACRRLNNVWNTIEFDYLCIFLKLFQQFWFCRERVARALTQRLIALRDAIERSIFFSDHEVRNYWAVWMHCFSLVPS